jgi:pimeloyl-ACP methyl ester carboxylesterase
MPREIREIESKLESKANAFQQEHSEDFHTYTVGKRTMQYVEVGHDPHKPLVLFVHGSPGDWKAWVEFLNDPDLTAHANLIAVDRPGFGGSGQGVAEPYLERQCLDISPLLDRASTGQKIILVGHSFGGPVVCRLAMDHPVKVTDVIVLAGSIDPAQEKTEWYQYVAEWPVLRWLLPTELVMANEEIMPLKQCLTEMMPLWPKITQRVTVIQGGNDTLVPPENADFAKRVMISARPLTTIRLPGINHFLPWKKYDLVKASILKYLAD